MPSNIDVLQGELTAIKQEVRREARDAITDSLENARSVARSELRTSDAVASRELVNSLYVESRSLSSKVIVKLVTELDYAAFVEYGTGPQFGTSPWLIESPIPRFDAPTMSTTLVRELLEWVKVKGLTPHGEGFSQRDLAYFIANHISVEGTPPQPFMRPAWFQTEDNLKRAVRRAVRSATS